jgi:hypothetical protein
MTGKTPTDATHRNGPAKERRAGCAARLAIGTNYRQTLPDRAAPHRTTECTGGQITSLVNNRGVARKEKARRVSGAPKV